ncbi:MAG: response regulator [Anaerolineae bacterium]
MNRFRNLVVDDAVFIRRALAQILQASEFEIVGEAANGKEAVQEYRRLLPDVVLMDIMMPEMNGIEAVRQIKQEHPRAKIVMCSAFGQEKVIIEALSAGALDFIVKPFLPEKVLATLRHAVRLSTKPAGAKELDEAQE